MPKPATFVLPFFTVAYMLVEGLQDGNIFSSSEAFLRGRESNSDESSPNWITNFILCLAAIPLALTIAVTIARKNKEHQVDEEVSRSVSLSLTSHSSHRNWEVADQILVSNSSIQSRTQEEKEEKSKRNCVDYKALGDDFYQETEEDQHHHHPCQTVGELIAIGAPFACFAYTGMYAVVKHLSPAWAYSLSIASALVSGYGNYSLHSHHHHAKEGVRVLYGKLSSDKCKAILSCLGIVIGHFVQGFGASLVLIKTLPLNDEDRIYFNIIFSLMLSILITKFEATTEMRSTLLRMATTDSENSLVTSKITRVITGLVSMVHAAMPTLGAIEFAEFLNQNALLSLPSWARAGIFILSSLMLGIPNALGFYHTTLESTDVCFKSITSFTRHWFQLGCQNNSERPLLREAVMVDELPEPAIETDGISKACLPFSQCC